MMNVLLASALLGAISPTASAQTPQPTSLSAPAKAEAAERTSSVLQPSPTPRYDPREAFGRLVLPEAVNRYRSGDGAPGPDYWQNRADDRIDARLDPRSHVSWGRSGSTQRFASLSPTGRSNTPSPATSSAPWRARVVRI